MGKIYCVMGKSASGKDTLYRMILKAVPELKEYIMYSTRPQRAGEADGVTYHFTDPAYLEKMKEAGKLIESRVYQTVYGPWIYATVDDGQICLERYSYLVPATLESFLCLRNYYGEEQVVPVYIEVEDGERLLRAIGRERKQEKPKYEEMCRRFLADSRDFSEEKLASAGIARRFENDLPERAAEEIARMIREDMKA